VLPVSANRIVPLGAAAPAIVPVPDQFEPFLEISREFMLSQAQVDGDENLQLAPSYAKSAASVIAYAEDTILFFGPLGIGAVLATGVNVTNQPAALPLGFVAEAIAYPPFTGVLGNILAAVAGGIAALNGRAQTGPYALFLSPDRYAQSFAPPANFLRAPGDQLNHVVTGGFYMVNSLALVPPPNDIGILVSLGGEPAKIILGTDAITAFTYTDGGGNYHFRVFERIQLVVRDGRAFQILQYP